MTLGGANQAARWRGRGAGRVGVRNTLGARPHWLCLGRPAQRRYASSGTRNGGRSKARPGTPMPWPSTPTTPEPVRLRRATAPAKGRIRHAYSRRPSLSSFRNGRFLLLSPGLFCFQMASQYMYLHAKHRKVKGDRRHRQWRGSDGRQCHRQCRQARRRGELAHPPPASSFWCSCWPSLQGKHAK